MALFLHSENYFFIFTPTLMPLSSGSLNTSHSSQALHTNTSISVSAQASHSCTLSASSDSEGFGSLRGHSSGLLCPCTTNLHALKLSLEDISSKSAISTCAKSAISYHYFRLLSESIEKNICEQGVYSQYLINPPTLAIATFSL